MIGNAIQTGDKIDWERVRKAPPTWVPSRRWEETLHALLRRCPVITESRRFEMGRPYHVAGTLPWHMFDFSALYIPQTNCVRVKYRVMPEDLSKKLMTAQVYGAGKAKLLEMIIDYFAPEEQNEVSVPERQKNIQASLVVGEPAEVLYSTEDLYSKSTPPGLYENKSDPKYKVLVFASSDSNDPDNFILFRYPTSCLVGFSEERWGSTGREEWRLVSTNVDVRIHAEKGAAA